MSDVQPLKWVWMWHWWHCWGDTVNPTVRFEGTATAIVFGLDKLLENKDE